MAMTPPNPVPAPAQRVAERVFGALERFMHVEAVSGIVLLVAAVVALVWANSPAAAGYQHFWHLPLSIGLGDHAVSWPLHFLINDALMTIFFLVVGMEIRREIHEGALANMQLATLPIAAAAGGVAIPALLYLSLNSSEITRQGWAVPTATDIAFAVGVLALLGRSIPPAVRAFLLALAIIDDIVAVVIIAVFYSDGIQLIGFAVAAAGIALVFGFQKIGIARAYAYVIPGAIVWFGLLKTGAHPSLAGVILGMLTPVRPMLMRGNPLDVAARALRLFGQRREEGDSGSHHLMEPLKELKEAQRELLPPVVRVQLALHPWVAYGVMPLFALANAGVSLEGIDLASSGSLSVMLGTGLALFVGKPVGIVFGSWCAVRLRWCRLPPDVTWHHVWLVGCLGGIGFTMSIFIATLAFAEENLLTAAKAGVLVASGAAGIVGVLFGLYLRRNRNVAI